MVDDDYVAPDCQYPPPQRMYHSVYENKNVSTQVNIINQLTNYKLESGLAYNWLIVSFFNLIVFVVMYF